MSRTTVAVRPAEHADISALHAVIQRAYRGDSARTGWTHEADLLDDERITQAALVAIVEDPTSLLLIAERDGAIIGSVQLTDKGAGEVYLGLFCIDPAMQRGGRGRALLAAAENMARRRLGAKTMTMTVIDCRPELIAYYIRRGYREAAWGLDFIVPHDPPLFMTRLEKTLGAFP
ncbi:GNAT family N-acetyltransferase [Sphingobium sp. DEHP117]|uniref:GNAT family N-acetyltransferase n=1 Tax=Sphingobium sp. DEHP117 TaxID=2993436 RepID=UPI0027D74151|nr:GNAT family N-acetyltransferase [Sphingobium sp. DEHP117]MDQ4420897.1 GNAT family N-acetyltransferase [Sphingobium sp. DEHP117]